MDTATDATDVRALAAAVTAGDERAFRALFDMLYSPLVAYSAGLCGSRHLAEDLAQEAFVRLWRNRARIDPARSVRALLFVSVRNLSFNANRERSTHRKLLHEMETTHSRPPDYGGVDAGRLRDRLREWIAKLPDREQEAFRLSRFTDLTHQEIADVMGISKGTVEKHITNALRKLRDRIKAFDPEILKS